MALRSLLRPTSLFNPLSRVALATYAWKHRHEILRWGRSLYEQLIGRRDVSPARAVQIGRVLMAVASDETLRNASQLRSVSLEGDVVHLDVDQRWSRLPRLIDRVKAVDGVRTVVVNGTADAPGTLAAPARA
jgi:hypothetical protein